MGYATLAEVKTELCISHHDDDAYLTQQIEWVSAWMDHYMGRSLVAQSVVQTIRCPSGFRGYPIVIGLDVYPVTTLASVEIDAVAAAADDIEINNTNGELQLADGAGAKEIEITYTGGYSTIPPEVVQTCIDLVMSRYYGRGGDPTKIVRSENVPDVGSVDYTVSLFYQKNYDPFIGIYGTTLDMYRDERALGLSRNDRSWISSIAAAP